MQQKILGTDYKIPSSVSTQIWGLSEWQKSEDELWRIVNEAWPSMAPKLRLTLIVYCQQGVSWSLEAIKCN